MNPIEFDILLEKRLKEQRSTFRLSHQQYSSKEEKQKSQGMINVTEYLRKNGFGKKKSVMIRNFLARERVKYIIANGEKKEIKMGRDGYTLFSKGLFKIFCDWMERKPIPLLCRMEDEVNEFISEFFGKETIRQYPCDGFIYDWFIPSLNILIEFNEVRHIQHTDEKNKDKIKQHNAVFVLHEKSVMKDLANLAKLKIIREV